MVAKKQYFPATIVAACYYVSEPILGGERLIGPCLQEDVGCSMAHWEHLDSHFVDKIFYIHFDLDSVLVTDLEDVRIQTSPTV